MNKNFKIHVHSPEENKQIQLRLFQLGCVWLGDDKPELDERHSSNEFIYVRNNIITCGSTLEYFNSIVLPEVNPKHVLRPFKFGRRLLINYFL